MPVRPHAAAQPEDEARTVLEQGEEEQDDQGSIESFCNEEDRSRELRPEERAADSLVEDIFQTDGKQKGGKHGLAFQFCPKRQNKAEEQIDSDEERGKQKFHGVPEGGREKKGKEKKSAPIWNKYITKKAQE